MARAHKQSGGGSRSSHAGQYGGGTERTSLTSLVGQTLGEESQEGLERVMDEVKRYFDESRRYISENPKEAAGLAIAVGFAAWALLGTKPGRNMLESGTGYAVPQVARWFKNLGIGTGERQRSEH